MRNVSQQGQKDIQNVGNILQTVQTFLTEKGSIISQDTEANLERELDGIQHFIRHQQRKFQQHHSSLNSSKSASNSSDTNATKVVEFEIPILHAGLEYNHNFNNLTGGESRTTNSSRAGRQNGMVQNIMQFSSKVYFK